MLQVVEGNAILTQDTVNKIVEFERLAKEIKAKEDELKAHILSEMEAYGVLSIDCPELRISYVTGSNREVFDSKGFRKDFPDLFDEYVTLSPTKASIRIKVK